MTCPNCHSKIDDSNKYCNYCGKKIENPNEHENQYDYSHQYSNIEKKDSENHEDQYSYSMLYSNMYNNTITSDEDYQKGYIGPNYEMIKNNKFSLPAFAFGSLYLFYRKLWLYAIILILINIFSLGYLDSNTVYIVNLTISICLGIKFNSFYLNYTQKKVDEIKISNPDKTSTELLDVCKKKGGTLQVSTLIGITLAIFFATIIIILIAMSYEYYESNPTTKPTFEENGATNEYNKLENMTYKQPMNTRASEYNNNSYHYYNTLPSANTDCSFTLSTNKYTNLYKTPDEYINKNVFKDSTSKELINTTTTINNIAWRYLSIESDSRTENYYVTNFNNSLYIIEIRAYGDSKVSTCKNAENDLLNSISFEITKVTK